jgi:hypothetical protein
MAWFIRIGAWFVVVAFAGDVGLGQDLSPSTEIWNGLRTGLMKDGKPGECMKGYPKTVEAYTSFQSTLPQTSLQPKLHSFQIFFNRFSDLVSTCKVESLFTRMFSIYQWEVLQPILIILASNITYFILLVKYFLISLENGFYYNIGFYLGEIIQLLFTFSI